MSQKNGNGDNETLNEALKGIDDLLAQVTTMYDSCEGRECPPDKKQEMLKLLQEGAQKVADASRGISSGTTGQNSEVKDDGNQDSPGGQTGEQGGPGNNVQGEGESKTKKKRKFYGFGKDDYERWIF